MEFCVHMQLLLMERNAISHTSLSLSKEMIHLWYLVHNFMQEGLKLTQKDKQTTRQDKNKTKTQNQHKMNQKTKTRKQTKKTETTQNKTKKKLQCTTMWPNTTCCRAQYFQITYPEVGKQTEISGCTLQKAILPENSLCRSIKVPIVTTMRGKCIMKWL